MQFEDEHNFRIVTKAWRYEVEQAPTCHVFHSVHYLGWVLGAGDGYTKNSQEKWSDMLDVLQLDPGNVRRGSRAQQQ